MNVLTTTVARILFALPFLIFGLMHLSNGDKMTEMIPSFVPAPLIMNYIAGAGMALAAIAVIIKKKGDLACLLLALQMLLFIVLLHIPKIMQVPEFVEMMGGNEEMTMATGMVHTLKDLGLMAGALTYAGILKGK